MVHPFLDCILIHLSPFHYLYYSRDFIAPASFLGVLCHFCMLDYWMC